MVNERPTLNRIFVLQICMVLFQEVFQEIKGLFYFTARLVRRIDFLGAIREICVKGNRSETVLFFNKSFPALFVELPSKTTQNSNVLITFVLPASGK